MTKRMLIDAGHREETRVAVSDGRELQEFDVESAVKSQLKGNIYLAKVTRVEPSLQAAFIEYGGNRHGFLAFSEIHPDYFQLPVSDREELAAEQARLVAEANREDDEDPVEAPDEDDDDADTPGEDAVDGETPEDGDADGPEPAAAPPRTEAPGDRPASRSRHRRSRRRNGEDEGDRAEAAMHSAILRRGYRIQEVVKRRQILLVQVVKEERGNKGAALTTYMSIAGRYCVLMPNTPRGGGVSRKIADATQRRRLKEVAAGLEVPQGMGLIVRTAGQGRTKVEIKRDFNSLLKQWEDIRSDTLRATAPSLIHEEANIIKRAIRDLYAKDIDEVLVEGDEGYRSAKAYMKFLMPSHAARVKPYRDRTSLFHRYEVERQLDAMHSPVVQLKSGGYIVIDPTEALVAIDVNSGRSTRERNIEETALKTNVEAAQEIARQLRLRDLAGLIVIDFIDMDEHRNERAVERKFKDAVKADRARTQIGRISGFGLLELSRQRLRPSLQEALSSPCPHCAGSGHMRSTESTVLHVLRGIEDEALKGRAASVRVLAPTEVALYLLNRKRQALIGIEERHGLTVVVERGDGLVAPDYEVQVVAPAARGVGEDDEREPSRDEREPSHDERQDGERRASEGDEDGGRRASEGDEDGGRRRKRRRRGRRDRDDDAAGAAEKAGADNDGARVDGDSEDGERKRRRRGKRGGRRARERGENDEQAAEAGTGESAADAGGGAEDAPKPRRRRRAGKDERTADAEPPPAETADEALRDGGEPAAVRETAGEESSADGGPEPEREETAAGVTTTVVGADAAQAGETPPPRRGWWQKIVDPR